MLLYVGLIIAIAVVGIPTLCGAFSGLIDGLCERYYEKRFERDQEYKKAKANARTMINY